MPPDPSSSVRAARQALANRLDELRRDAGLSGKELAGRCQWNPSKASRIANAKSSPSEQDIRAWCIACSADDQIPDLIAAQRAMRGTWIEWRRMMRAGLAPVQAGMLPLYERTRHFRAYSSWILPGMIQTRGYAHAVLHTFATREHLIDDVEAATSARMERAALLQHAQRRFAFLIEEHLLRTSVTDTGTMIDQLNHLLAVAAMPNVSLGIVPAHPSRGHWPVEDFWLFDDDLVRVELVSGELTVSQPTEVAAYIKTFARLAADAVHGDHARALINNAIADNARTKHAI